jgi:hypothetical protein
MLSIHSRLKICVCFEKRHTKQKEEASMSQEIDELKARISELEQENAGLKTNTKKDIQDKLKRETWEVLKYFFDLPATATVITSQIASHFRLPANAAQYYLDSLVTCGFIMTVPNPLSTFRNDHAGFFYMMTPHGRGFVMANTAVRFNTFHPVRWIKSRTVFSKRRSPNYITPPPSAQAPAKRWRLKTPLNYGAKMP